ncbi:MAG TPA: hypothetical protein PL193_14270, partial [Xanthobacteraceae bacterium]|nr:hypothetical protein [Xanthobacteraceae bacterium]
NDVDQNTTRRMQMILQSSGNSPEELERAYGKTMDEIRLDLRDQIRILQVKFGLRPDGHPTETFLQRLEQL